MKILITAAATAQAYQLERTLEEGQEVCFADSAELPDFMFQNKKFIRIPKGDAPSFAHELLTVCLDHDITRVFPLRSEEVIALSESKVLFSEYGIEVVVPSVECLKNLTFRSKPGTVIFKIPGRPNSEVPSHIDCGIFLSDPASPGNVSIFSAS